MSWFGKDLLSTLTDQFTHDKARKAREAAALSASPDIALRISSYRAKYPWLTPGVSLSAAQAGLDVSDPAIARLADLTATRKSSKGQGWFSIGDRPINPLSGVDTIMRSLKDIAEVSKPVIRWGLTAAQSGPESLQSVVRTAARDISDNGLIKGLVENEKRGFAQESAAVKSTPTLGLPKQDFTDSPTTFGVAMQARRNEITLPNNPAGGAGIGQGYLPRGPSTEEQSRRARESYFLEYADHPIFSLPGTSAQPSTQHAGTLGRITAKTVFQPGSRPFNFLSGVIDAAFTWYADPVAKSISATSELRAGREVFSAVDAGLLNTEKVAAKVGTRPAQTAREVAGLPKSDELFTAANEYLPGAAPSDLGLLQGVRPAIHPPTTQNWLTLSAPGRKFTQWAADNPSTYDIWKTLGGEKGKITPELAKSLSSTRSTDEVLTVLGDELGTGLRTKPITSSFQPVGGYLGEVRNSAYSSRIFNTLPHAAVDLEDPSESAVQLVRVLKNGKMSDEQIAPLFDELASAATKDERGQAFRNIESTLAAHIANTELTGPISGRDINYSRLRGLFAHDQEAMSEITRRQIANKSPINSLTVNGAEIPLRSPYQDAEYFDRFYQLPDPRAMRRITSQYGRLLNHPVLDIPIGVLDHLSSVWRNISILRPALTLRVVGEEQARMAASGLDSVVNHPLSAISWAAGKSGTSDILGEAFSASEDLSAFTKSLAKNGTWRDAVVANNRQVLPFTDPGFVKSWGKDIYNLHADDVAKQIASGIGLPEIKTWLASDAATEYRSLNSIIPDAVDGYVDNLSNWIKGKTYGNQSLLDAIATGQHNGSSIFNESDQGHRTLSTPFQSHLKGLVDKDISPDHTIGDIITPRNSQQSRDLRRTVTDKLFNTLLTKPSNYLSRSPTFRQTYWQRIEEGIIHATPEAQAEIISNAEVAGLSKSVLKQLRTNSTRVSGNLSLDELDLYAKSHALSATKSLLYDLTDRNQLLDSLRLVFPFGEAWKEVLTTWGHIIAERPQIIPRAEAIIHGAEGSGFFYPDPATGEEMFNYPGSQFVTKHLFGIPSPLSARASSLNMFSNNPLLPGFGPLVQVPVSRILPDTPTNDFVRGVIAPYGEPTSPLPSWAGKFWTAAFGDPDKQHLYANTVMDVARYLQSTGKYDLSTDAGKQRLEDDSRSKAKLLYAFRGLAQSSLPASPSYQDVAEDKSGHTTLAFVLTDRYRTLLEEDKSHSTNLATDRFINEFGLPNLLYMQSASKGGDVFSKSGYDWVRSNPAIVDRYPGVYGLIAPNDGGFDQRAYNSMFDKGTRKVLSLKESLSLANSRAAKMVLRNAESQIPIATKRTDAQRVWLDDVKSRLVEKFPGFDPSYQGSDVPAQIAELTRAVNDPLLSKQPITPAIRAYLSARDSVIAISKSHGIIGWQTAKALTPQRDWLSSVAEQISKSSPGFTTIYSDLFFQELR